MKRFRRALISLVVLVVLLVTGGFLWVTTVFDPEMYRDRLAAWVTDQTGSEFSVAGEFSLQLGFPRWRPVFTVVLGSVALSNPEGFNDEDLFRASEMSARVRLWPLFWGRLEPDSMSLKQPVIRLVRRDHGQTNWQYLFGGVGSSDDHLITEWDLLSSFAAVATLGIGIADGTVQWVDEHENRHLTLSQIDFEMGSLTRADKTDFQFHFDAISSAFSHAVSIDVESQAQRDSGSERIRLEQMQVTAARPGLLIGLEARELKMDTGVGRTLVRDAVLTGAVDGNEARFVVDAAEYSKANHRLIMNGGNGQIIAAGLDAKLDFSMASMQIFEKDNRASSWNLLGDIQSISVSSVFALLLQTFDGVGRFQLSESDWGSLLGQLGFSLVEGYSGPVQPVHSSGEFSVADGVLEVSLFDASVGDSRLVGSLTLENLSQPRLRFELTADRLDFDKLMQPLIPPTQEPKIQVLLPVMFFMGLDAAGGLEVAEGWWAGMKLEDVSFNVDSQPGRVRIDPFKAKLYEGTVTVTVLLDTRNDRIRFQTRQDYADVQLGSLLAAVGITDRIEALGDLVLELDTEGSNDAERLATATGGANLVIRQGRLLDLKVGHLLGIELEQIVRQVRAALGIEPQLMADTEEGIRFSDLAATLTVANGELWNHRLDFAVPGMNVQGRGRVSPTDGMIDYRLYARLDQPIHDSGLPLLDQIEALVLPLRLTGPLDSIKVALDIPELLRLLTEGLSADTNAMWLDLSQ